MSDRENDSWLDARLCDVPVSDTLAARLRGISELSDEELDWLLTDVLLPKGLLFRVRQVVADEELDEQLRDVPLPEVALARTRIIPQRRKRSTVGRFALAASLMIALSLGFWSGLGGMLVAVRSQPAPAVPLYVVREQPLELAASTAVADVLIVPGPAPLGAEQLPADPRLPAEELMLLVTADRISPGPAGSLLAELGRQWDPGANWMRMRWPLLGYLHPEVQTLPDLESVELPVGRGFSAPLTRAFDREFLYSRGFQPPVMVPADEQASGSQASTSASTAEARRTAVPLSTSSESYERFLGSLDRGRLLAADEFRAEDFLAALDYGLPPAEPGQVALRTAAGPSVFNPSDAGLLQIAAKAGLPPEASSAPIHLTVALDVSASMAWGQRLDAARTGLLRALAQLRPADRFSLIVFREEPLLLVNEVGRADLPRIYELLAGLRPGGNCNLNEALQQAIVSALDSDRGAPPDRRLVLITDSGGALGSDAARGLASMLQAAAEQPFRFDILNLNDDPQDDARLAELAAAGGGAVHRLQSASQIRWRLVEVLRQAPALIASEAKLEVEFNPRAVAAYRLIGHHTVSSGGLLPGDGRVELHAGEEATALFELWLYPNDEDDVAVARLEWKDPESGQIRQSPPQRISRLQFATSFEGSAISLQLAAIAAEAAEVLQHGFNFSALGSSGYRYEPKPRGLEHVLQVAGRTRPQLAQRPDYRQLLQSLRTAQRLTRERPPGLARSGSRGINAGRWRELRE